jgi:1-acyl-sn-glycerol-3-phosphate acyltransferase
LPKIATNSLLLRVWKSFHVKSLSFVSGAFARSNTMGRFKSGSFKLVTGANSLVVPLTIDGTYKTLEERGTVSPADIKLTIHPVVDISKLSSSEINALPEYIESIVRSAL